MQPAVFLDKVAKYLPNDQTQGQPAILQHVDLKIAPGEFVTLFGPNGCGKTTLLNLIAGVDTPTKGQVLVNGKDPRLAKVGMVFQNYNESMLPWRTALGNIKFALEVQHLSDDKVQKIAQYWITRIGLADHKDKFFYNLSGGMKQLISIARAFAYEPELLLMDEPFSALDYSVTRKMELELLDLWHETKKTILFVSHEIDEAIFLADKVIVLSKRPTVIKKVIPVNLPRPRKLEMIESSEFFKIRNKVLEAFNDA